MAVMVSITAVADEDATAVALEASAIPARYELSTLIQAPPATSSQLQHVSFASLTNAMANESFSEAEVAAKHMVEQVNADSMDAASARARALHNLAVVQQFRGSHDSAIQNYSAALNIIAGEDGNVSPSLILPLRGLATAYLD